MKRIVSLFISLAIVLSTTACNSNAPNKENSSKDIVQTYELVQLTNKMTETELSRVYKHGLTLLDAPEEPTTEAEPEPEQAEHKISVEFETISIDEIRNIIESMRDYITDKEYEKYKALIDSGEDYATIPVHILVDGMLCTVELPSSSDPNYDGGEFTYKNLYNGETGELTSEELSFSDFYEYLDSIKKKYIENGCSEEELEDFINGIQSANEALKNGDYETLPEGSVNLDSIKRFSPIKAEKNDYRDVWEYDRDAVEAIKESIDEINIYDEELDTEFLVHVTLPPNYDNEKAYPVFLLTDGVWRFGNHTELRKVMERGQAADVILVSLGYNYHIDGTDLGNRYNDLVVKSDQLLDFITENLMPFLGQNYIIDYANSTLYGHSDGGVFTHNALFKSDLYDNQPFGNYIIGSPAFWGLYYENHNLDPEGCVDDYGYFDRNETLGKSVFLCAGSLEDPDYAESYNGHDTTLEGVENLKKRLESHNADLTYKLYDSHHYQYIPEMLIEYLKEKYPC
ncbi:MAG: hypothetical protein KBH06_14880 [Spirochaetes bacterium]|nr:hypothetical protein [Spirochaetota bacterium]